MRKKLFKSTASLLLAGVMVLSGSGFSVMAASANVATPSAVSVEEKSAKTDGVEARTETGSPIIVTDGAIDFDGWESVAFGQSTDVNFSTNVLPEKVGLNNSEITQIRVREADGKVRGKDAVVVESRGGKIANGHDGLTFFYKKLDVNTNFELEAKVFFNQVGPEVNNATPAKQEAIGLMVRDVNGQPRQEPLLEGYEELPAASNMVATMLQANAKSHTSTIDIKPYQRNGVYNPTGNGQISYGGSKFATLAERGGAGKANVTDDITPAEGEIYDGSQFFTLKLKKDETGFVTTYIAADGTEYSKTVDDPGRLGIIDKDNMYVGVFASRNAKATYTDIKLTTSEGTLPESTFVPVKFAAKIDNYSNKSAQAGAYDVVLRTNYDGTIVLTKDGVEIASVTAVAGEDLVIPTTIEDDTTSFKAVLSSEGTELTSSSFTVNKISDEYANRDLYISPDGTSAGKGTANNPLDLDTALDYVSNGHTVYALPGTYGRLVLNYDMSGAKDNMKTLTATGGAVDIIFDAAGGNSHTVNASYWVLDGLKVTGSGTAGMRVNGSSNIITNCEFYENGDTGLQLGLGSGTSSELWPKDNTVSYCYSHHNVDISNINADGFAAKLGVGTGNVFKYCESAYNADDGWDIFNKQGDIKNDPVTMLHCVAHDNGNNGFKLGGEGYAVDNVVEYSLAYNNGMDGFTDNFNPGVLTVKNNTSINNTRYNYMFRFNPYLEASDAGTFENNVSFRTDENLAELTEAGLVIYNDYIYSSNTTNSYYYSDGNSGITVSDFVSLVAPTQMSRNADGTFDYEGFTQPTKTGKLYNGGNYIGAVEPEGYVELESIKLDKTTLTLDTIGASQKLTVIYVPEGADKEVTWSSSNAKVATVDQNGLVKAIANGTAKITAKVGDLTAECTVTVNAKPKNVAVTSVKLSKTALSFDTIGASQTVSATVAPTNATDKKVTWKSSNSKVATVVNGKITAIGNGTATITATAGGKSANCTVTVSQKVTKVQLQLNKQNVKGTLKVQAKKSYSFKAVTTPTNADSKNAKVKWTTSNKKVATVSSKGKVKIKGTGKVKITATTADGKKATITLNSTKKAVKVSKIKVSGSKSMKLKKKQKLSLTISPVTAANQKVTWKTSNKKIATVNSKGVVTAKKKGKVTITATAKDGSKKKATIKITIKK